MSLQRREFLRLFAALGLLPSFKREALSSESEQENNPLESLNATTAQWTNTGGMRHHFTMMKIRVPSRKNWFAHWYCDLNGWEWPKELGEPPDWIKCKFSQKTQKEVWLYRMDDYHRIMNTFEFLAGGRKEVMRVHLVERIRCRTNEEFERWWKIGLGEFANAS